MKKNISLARISLAISLSFLLWACNNPEPSSPAKVSSKDTISAKAALKMIRHYRDSSVYHDPGGLVRMMRFQNAALKGICESDGTTTFWTAADTITNKMMIIVQMKSVEGGSTFMAISGDVCPPPTTPPCDTTYVAEFK